MEGLIGALAGAAGLLLAGAITPGPNNFVVMREAARAGWPGALRAIAGIVAGGLALLAVVVAGAGAVFAAEPALAAVTTAAGCLYLAWVGVRLIAAAGRPEEDEVGPEGGRGLPAGVRGLFVFQFLNPKAWVLVLTATSAARSQGGLAALAGLAVLMVAIPAVCLTLWSAFGLLMTRRLRSPAVRAWFDRSMGGLLVVSALLLLAGSIGGFRP
jgi:threonine/homoserine/homoserine lactone efflux protein